MLHTLHSQNLNLTNNLSTQSPSLSKGQQIVQSAKKYLVDIISASNSAEPEQVQQLIAVLNNLSCESLNSLASKELWDLAQDNLYHPELHGFALNLLHQLEASGLPHAGQAKSLINSLDGKGSWANSLNLSIRKVAHSGEVAPLTLAMMGTGLVGKGIQAIATPIARHWGLARFGELAVRVAGAGAGLSAELVAYPGMHALGAGVLSNTSHLENFGKNYGEQVLEGAFTIGALRFAGLASRNLYRATHGIKQLGAPVSRFHALTPITRSALPLSGELMALGALSYAQDSSQNFSFCLAMGLGSVLEFRLGNHLGRALAPGLSQVYRRLDFQAYTAARSQAQRLWQGLRSSHLAQAGSAALQAKQWALATSIGARSFAGENPKTLKPAMTAQDFVAQMGGDGKPLGRTINRAITQPVTSAETFTKEGLIDILAALSFAKRGYLPPRMYNYYEATTFAPLMERLRKGKTGLLHPNQATTWSDYDGLLYVYLREARYVLPRVNLFRNRYGDHLNRQLNLIDRAMQQLESTHEFNLSTIGRPKTIGEGSEIIDYITPKYIHHQNTFWARVKETRDRGEQLKPFPALSFPSFMMRDA